VRSNWRTVLALILLTFGGLLWGGLSFPVAAEPRQVDLAGGMVVVSAPRQAWGGARADVQLVYTPSGMNALGGTVLEARLELPGATLLNPADIQAPLNGPAVVTFHWQVQTQNSGVQSGTLWLHQGLPEGDRSERELLLAVPLEWRVLDFAGLGAGGLRTIALLAIALSVIVWLSGRRRTHSTRPAE